MNINELKFSFVDLSKFLRQGDLKKVVEFKLNESEYFKCEDLANQEGITRQSMWEKIKRNPEKFEPIEFRSYTYYKKI